MTPLPAIEMEPSHAQTREQPIKPELGPKSKTVSPAAGLQPLAHFAEAVVAPEGLAVDDEEGRAEHTLVHRLLHFHAQALLDGGILHAGEDSRAVVADADRYVDRCLGFRRGFVIGERG